MSVTSHFGIHLSRRDSLGTHSMRTPAPPGLGVGSDMVDLAIFGSPAEVRAELTRWLTAIPSATAASVGLTTLDVIATGVTVES